MLDGTIWTRASASVTTASMDMTTALTVNIIFSVHWMAGGLDMTYVSALRSGAA